MKALIVFVLVGLVGTYATVSIKKAFTSEKRGIAVEHVVGQVGDNNRQDLTVKAENLVVGKPARHLDDSLRQQLQTALPRDRKVRVQAVAGDGEAFQFAEEVKNFLQSQRYDVSGVDQAFYSGPVVGQGIIPNGDGFEIRIGTNPTP